MALNPTAIGYREHVLKYPKLYIGDVDAQPTFLFEQSKPPRKIYYTPALLNMFNEILINAHIHSINRLSDGKKFLIDINGAINRITITNYGYCIDIIKENGKYIPTKLFSEFMSIGKDSKGNGMGAKLVNVFSSEFVIETYDHRIKKKFYQKFSNNMNRIDEPIITSEPFGTDSYVRVSFIPDSTKFEQGQLTDDMIAMFYKNTRDISTISTAEVYFNDKRI